MGCASLKILFHCYLQTFISPEGETFGASRAFPNMEAAEAAWGNGMYSTIESHTGQLGEQRLWMAVIARAVEEWVSGPLTSQREAEKYLFYDERDFPKVCSAAGLDLQALRTKLYKLKNSGAGPATLSTFSG